MVDRSSLILQFLGFEFIIFQHTHPPPPVYITPIISILIYTTLSRAVTLNIGWRQEHEPELAPILIYILTTS